MKYLIRTTIVFLLTWSTVFAQQGKLLIIGGGPENISSTIAWNYEAFNWAVEQSANKKVALLHYETESSESFENYFVSKCGATECRSFAVNRSKALNQSVVDEISQYDVFYFRGGDQYQYYTAWKDTPMEDAIHAKFNSGGVLCGTSAGLAILSGVIFTAENGSAYSDICLKDVNNFSVKLANDFIEVMPGFIFDSHFTQRGRMGRLVSFMAHWKQHQNEELMGIGVDEISALAIDSNKMATAYGAGTVNIFRLTNVSSIHESDVLSADSILVTALPHKKQVNLTDFSVEPFSDYSGIENVRETNTSKIYTSGLDNLGYANVDLLTDFIAEKASDPRIVILTGNNTDLANSFKSKLAELGEDSVFVYQATYSYANDDELKEAIEKTHKFIFVDNNSYNLDLFLKSDGKAGTTLSEAFENRKLYLAFIGDNARLPGKYIIGNYLGSEANSSVSEGLGLLSSAVIIPNTFKRNTAGGITDLWHASNAGIPYAMITAGVKTGIWLNNENYMVYKGRGGKAEFTVKGASPIMVLTQNNTTGALVQQTYDGTGSPDKKAAFDHMYLSVVKPGDTHSLGEYEPALTITPETFYNPLMIYPNPATHQLDIVSNNRIKKICLTDVTGRTMYTATACTKKWTIYPEKEQLPQGVYLLNIQNENGKFQVQKVIIK